MDEPFSALDVGLRYQLHQLLLEQQAASGMAVLLITHDLMEAVRLADDVLVMAPGPGASWRTTSLRAQRWPAPMTWCTAALPSCSSIRWCGRRLNCRGVGLAAECALGQWQEVGGGN